MSLAGGDLFLCVQNDVDQIDRISNGYKPVTIDIRVELFDLRERCVHNHDQLHGERTEVLSRAKGGHFISLWDREW